MAKNLECICICLIVSLKIIIRFLNVVVEQRISVAGQLYRQLSPPRLETVTVTESPDWSAAAVRQYTVIVIHFLQIE